MKKGVKKQTDIAKEQYQKLEQVYEFEKKEEDETKNIDKIKNKNCATLNKVKDLLFSNTTILKDSKELNEFKTKLELFYEGTGGIKV